MLNVNTKKISTEVRKLDKYISDYHDNCNNLFNEISKLSSYWKDDNQVKFEDKIVNEKINSLLLLEELEKIDSFYKLVEEIYNK